METGEITRRKYLTGAALAGALLGGAGKLDSAVRRSTLDERLAGRRFSEAARNVEAGEEVRSEDPYVAYAKMYLAESERKVDPSAEHLEKVGFTDEEDGLEREFVPGGLFEKPQSVGKTVENGGDCDDWAIVDRSYFESRGLRSRIVLSRSSEGYLHSNVEFWNPWEREVCVRTLDANDLDSTEVLEGYYERREAEPLAHTLNTGKTVGYTPQESFFRRELSGRAKNPPV